MVAGSVAPPRLDLTNEDLIRSHVHAIWLAETGAGPGARMTDVLDASGQEPALGVHQHIADQPADAASRRPAADPSRTAHADLHALIRDSAWWHADSLERT